MYLVFYFTISYKIFPPHCVSCFEIFISIFEYHNVRKKESEHKSKKPHYLLLVLVFVVILFHFFVLRLILLLLIIISTFISTTRLCVFIVLLMGSNRMPKAAIRLAWKNNVRFLYEQNSFQILQWFIFLLPFIR